MSTSTQGTSGPGGRAGFHPAIRERPISAEQSISGEVRKLINTVGTLHKESFATKQKIDALLKELGRLGLGADGGDTERKSQPTRSDAALAALERIKDKLQGLSDRVENAGRAGSNEDIKAVCDLTDGIRATVVDCESIISAASLPGELPPPAPRAFFGREALIEKIVGLTENLTPFALIGAGGIGKTAIALTVLHHDRIKKRFGGGRRFIRCDQFPASGAHFLARLSKVIGAGVENPEDLAPLRPSLSSKDMLIILDNAESILDPQGTDGRGIYTMVKELSHFSNICLGVTSRISIVPPHCKRLEIPTLSMEAARDIFYSIYDDDDHSDTINNLLERLEFHALSITLLATTASDNMWSLNRLIKKWDAQRAQVLRTDHNESLAATIELSLNSPTFRKLGPNARDLLGVVAFFPRGVDEENLEWLFSTIDDPETIFDKFCILSLTYRSNGFITMLAPIRDYFSPREPRSSSLLCTTKDHYLARLSVLPDPKKPKLGGDSPWIVLEDMNVEHLLDVFTSIDASALNVWDACVHFMDHLYWEKPRQTMLRLKIEALPDSHPSKAAGLFGLSRLFGSIGNLAEQKRLLVHTLTLERERGDDFRVALTLKWLSDVNMFLGLYEEGIPQVEEALEMFKQLDDKQEQATCLDKLAWLLLRDKQLDAAEDAVLRRMDLLPEKGEELQACQSHRLLGVIYYTKEDYEKAIPRLETALKIASASNWQTELFWTRYEMAILFRNKHEFDRASAHIEQAKSHAGNDAFNLGCGTEMQAWIWCEQGKLGDAKSEALRALEIYEKLGAAKNIKRSRGLVRQIEEAETGEPGSGERVTPM